MKVSFKVILFFTFFLFVSYQVQAEDQILSPQAFKTWLESQLVGQEKEIFNKFLIRGYEQASPGGPAREFSYPPIIPTVEHWLNVTMEKNKKNKAENPYDQRFRTFLLRLQTHSAEEWTLQDFQTLSGLLTYFQDPKTNDPLTGEFRDPQRKAYSQKPYPIGMPSFSLTPDHSVSVPTVRGPLLDFTPLVLSTEDPDVVKIVDAETAVVHLIKKALSQTPKKMVEELRPDGSSLAKVFGELEFEHHGSGSYFAKKVRPLLERLERGEPITPKESIGCVKDIESYLSDPLETRLQEMMIALKGWRLTPWWDQIRALAVEVLRIAGASAQAEALKQLPALVATEVVAPYKDEFVIVDGQHIKRFLEDPELLKQIHAMAPLPALFNKEYLSAVKSLCTIVPVTGEIPRAVQARAKELLEPPTASLPSLIDPLLGNFQVSLTGDEVNKLIRSIVIIDPSLVFIEKESFVTIPPGTFMMGSPLNEASRHGDEVQHLVTLTHSFEIQRTEVTQAQWLVVMGSRSNSNFHGYDPPVETITWWSAIAFANEVSKHAGLEACYDFTKLSCAEEVYDGTLTCTGELGINSPTGSIYDCEGYRLPTEAEWEYAARGGTTTAYSFGDDVNQLSDYAWFGENSNKQTHPVATKKPNQFELFDMHGNVMEWTQDWYGDYPSSPVTDPAGPQSGSSRVIRGGSWNSGAQYLRSASRYDFDPGYRRSILGFRLVRTIKK